jgi:chromosome partitioning protein
MRVISVLNQKGGVGKTTIAVHLARELQLMGNDVVLVDSDPQGSAVDWAASRDNQPLTVVTIDRPAHLKEREILRRVGPRDYVVIDGPPRLKEWTTGIITTSNLVIIPVQPSPYDIWATKELVELVKERIEITEGRFQAAFVVSRVIAGTKVGKEVVDILKEYELPIFNSIITQRVIFATSAAAGETALDVEPKSQAATEIKELTQEVINLFGVGGAQ